MSSVCPSVCEVGTLQVHSDGGYMGIYTPKISPSKLYGVKMTSERLLNSFIPPKKLLYPQNKFLATPLVICDHRLEILETNRTDN